MSLYGKFEIGGGTMYAKMPDSDNEPCCWTIEYVREDGVTQHRENLDMIHPPIFGPDVDDVRALNDRIEQLITELGLE